MHNVVIDKILEIIFFVAFGLNTYALANSFSNLIYITILKLKNYEIEKFVTLFSQKFQKQLQPKRSVSEPHISILIPARNEEDSIKECVISTLNQDYQNYKVIVLNDGSTDKTGQILNELATKNHRLEVIESQSFPNSDKPNQNKWTGKNWACWQLAQHEIDRNEIRKEPLKHPKYLLFIDADVTLTPQALKKAIKYMRRENLDLLSFSPNQVQKTLGEKLLVPNLNWLLYSFLPIPLVRVFDNKHLSAAIGQFIMVTSKSYQRTNGHKAIQSEQIDDIKMAQLYKANNFSTLVIPGTKFAACRMYSNMRNSFDGFARVIFPALGYSTFWAISTIIGFTAAFIIPFTVSAFNYLGITNSEYSWSILIIFSLINQLIINIIAQNNPIKTFTNILLDPFQRIFLISNIMYSLIKWRKKEITWKERKVT